LDNEENTMLILALMLLPDTAVSPKAPAYDAVGEYTLCVARMADARRGSDPEDATASVSAQACGNLLDPAITQVLQATTGDEITARKHVAALLEAEARRSAMRRVAIIKSYEAEKH
jgi:hypothetical protein